MRIRTTLLAGPGCEATANETAVVIDVLRATSVIATALAAGAREVIPCRETADARRIAAGLTSPPLLCGERGCLRIPGFDLGNSPSEYSPARVGDKTLVMTTTNGTAAIETAAAADQVLTASYLNLSAVVTALRTTTLLRLICAGTDRMPADEDISLAGALIERCQRDYGATIDDASRTAWQLWRRWAGEAHGEDFKWLVKRLGETRGGQNLIRAGLESDIASCARVDAWSVVPRLTRSDPATLRRG